MLWEYPFCLLGSNDGGERNRHATLYDESKHNNKDTSQGVEIQPLQTPHNGKNNPVKITMICLSLRKPVQK